MVMLRMCRCRHWEEQGLRQCCWVFVSSCCVYLGPFRVSGTLKVSQSTQASVSYSSLCLGIALSGAVHHRRMNLASFLMFFWVVLVFAGHHNCLLTLIAQMCTEGEKGLRHRGNIGILYSLLLEFTAVPMMLPLTAPRRFTLRRCASSAQRWAFSRSTWSCRAAAP